MRGMEFGTTILVSEKAGDRPQAEKRKRLLFVTQWFDPEPTFKGLSFAKELQRRGFDVEVVTGFPNYPGGNIYPGYAIRPIKKEFLDGLTISRLPLYPSHDGSAVGRALNYISFFVSVLLYLTLFARRAHVAYVYHPPLTVGLAAALAGLVRRTPIVLDVQDLWPDTLAATGMIRGERILSVIGYFCGLVYRLSRRIVVLSPGFAQRLVSRGVPASKISVIYNWAEEDALTHPSGQASDWAKGDRFNILFAGNVGRAQRLDTLLDAAKLTAEEEPRIQFAVLGGGLELQHLMERAKFEHLANVTFLPPVPMAEVGSYLSTADCLLVHLKDDPLFSITIPSKTQAYMACGRPIIMAVPGDAAALVRQAGCGRPCRPENARDLADAAIALSKMPKTMLVDMGNRGRVFYQNTLSFSAGVSAFATIFRAVAR